MTNPLNDDRVWAMFYRDNKTLHEISMETGYAVDEIDGVKVLLTTCNDIVARLSRVFSKERRDLVNALDEQMHHLDQADKCIDNLVEALDAATGRKHAEREAKRKEEAKKLKVRRNGNYLQSVKLGFHRGLWTAPTVLLAALREPFLGLIGSALMLVFRLTMFALGLIGIPILGLLGLISPSPKPAE